MNKVIESMRAAVRMVFPLGLILFLGLSAVQAQPGDSGDWGDKEKPYGWGQQPPDTKHKLTCLVANDPYLIHFTSYLESVGSGTNDPKKAFKRYCQDLPRVGKAFITIDLLNKESRGQQVGVEIVEMVKDAQPVVLAEVAPKAYPYGVIEAQANFEKPGMYSVNLAFNGAMTEKDVLKVPLTVGLNPEKPESGRSGIPLEIPVGLTILGVVGFFAYLHIQQKRKS